jgi:hypothetical protein
MRPNRGARIGRLLALGGFALVSATNGCSQLIAHSDVSSASEIYKPQTRVEVREAFGGADETGACPDGRPMERQSIRQKAPYGCTSALRGRPCLNPYLLFVEPLVFYLAVYIK